MSSAVLRIGGALYSLTDANASFGISMAPLPDKDAFVRSHIQDANANVAISIASPGSAARRIPLTHAKTSISISQTDHAVQESRVCRCNARARAATQR